MKTSKTIKTPKTRLALLVGDESKDGHGETEHVHIRINCTVKQLNNAYKKGAVKLGYDFELKAASEYGKRRLDKAVFDKLKELGWKVPKGFALKRTLDVDIYVDIWIFLAKLGRPGLTVETPKIGEVTEWPIGGYALFGDEED